MSLIYKIAPHALWADAQAAGQFTGAPIDLADGYIHFSTATQSQETVDKYFHGQADLVLIAVETEGLGEALRWEPSRGGELFPHLYAPLSLAAVRHVAAIPMAADGSHDLTGLLA